MHQSVVFHADSPEHCSRLNRISPIDTLSMHMLPCLCGCKRCRCALPSSASACKQESHVKALCNPTVSGAKAVCVNMCFAAAVYRFQQVSDILYRRNKQQQQQGGEDREEDEAQSLDLWLLTDSTLAQLMDPQLAAPAVQFLVLEVTLVFLDAHVNLCMCLCA